MRLLPSYLRQFVARAGRARPVAERKWRSWLLRTALVPPLAVVALALYVPLLLADALFFLARPLVRRQMRLASPDVSRATIIIVSWNGRALLEAGLPSVLAATREAGGQHQVIVVDNGSTDGSVDFLKRCYPEVRIVPLPRNHGFGEGNNIGARAASTDVVVFLNNDMVVEPGFLAPLLEPMREANVFAVASQIFFPDPTKRREETGKTRGDFIGGRMRMRHDTVDTGADPPGSPEAIPVLWAGGGSAAFHRQGFLQLGGFDPLYRPFYWEDADLSYRAWKAGWRCLFAPESRVLHCHRASTSRFGRRFVDLTVRKNEYLFTWRNITRPSWLLQHFCALPLHAADEARDVGPSFALGALLRAARQYPEVLARRFASWRESVLGDSLAVAAANGRQSANGVSGVDFAVGDFAGQLGRGWHKREGAPGSQYRWMERRAETYLSAIGQECALEIAGYLPEHVLKMAGGTQALKVHVDGRVAARVRLNEAGPFRRRVAVGSGSAGWVRIGVAASFAYTPASAGMGADQRELALCISRIALLDGELGRGE